MSLRPQSLLTWGGRPQYQVDRTATICFLQVPGQCFRQIFKEGGEKGAKHKVHAQPPRHCHCFYGLLYLLSLVTDISFRMCVTQCTLINLTLWIMFTLATILRLKTIQECKKAFKLYLLCISFLAALMSWFCFPYSIILWWRSLIKWLPAGWKLPPC